MINLMLGSSGSGKSYEATVYHVLEALKHGRKVITNLPLNLDAFIAIDSSYGSLIEIRTRSNPKRGDWVPATELKAFQVYDDEEKWTQYPVTKRPFSHVWDYYDEWRHPENGTGALIIVDEAQNVISNRGCDIEVEEYTALHRHWFNDIIFITQSYGKLSKDIRENVQMVYRFRKMVAWGRPDKYIRKVQDGLRGEVLNTTERVYESKYFPLYRSHTQADGVGQESSSADIIPIWRHWSFMGAGAMAVIFLGMLFTGNIQNPLKPKINSPAPMQFAYSKAITKDSLKESKSTDYKNVSQSKEADIQTAQTVPIDDEPLANRGVHIMGHAKSKTREAWLFAVSQNGQLAFNMNLKDLLDAGYTFKGMGDCVALITYRAKSRYIACDAPQQSVAIGGVKPNQDVQKPAETVKASI